MNYRGLVHVHSSYSCDGTVSIGELVKECQKRNLDFVFLTEHVETMTTKDMKALAEECSYKSSPDFLIIPGLEYSNFSQHLLALNTDEYINGKSEYDVMDVIHEHGGLCVLAHPKLGGYVIDPGVYRRLDGIEVWNPVYDGIAPNNRSISLLGAGKIGFGGCDLHELSQLGKMIIEIQAPRLTRERLVDALRNGDFTAENKHFKMSSNPKVRVSYEFFTRMHDVYQNTLTRLASILRLFGIKPPHDISTRIKNVI